MYWLACDDVYEIFTTEKKTIGTNSKPLSRARVNVSNTGTVRQKSKLSLKAKNC